MGRSGADGDAEELKAEAEIPPYDPGPVVTRTALVRNKYGRRQKWIEVVIPTDAEINRIALELHARGVPTRTQILGWLAGYLPPRSVRWRWVTSDPFTKEQLSEATESESRIGSQFFLV